MSQLVYNITPLERSVKFWVKQVQAVTPLQGNGFDIQGPFVNSMGMLEAGTLLCSGESLPTSNDRLVVYYQAWKVMDRDEATQHGHAWRDNVAMLRSSGQPFRFEEMEAAHRDYPELTPVLHKACAPVWWILLVHLAAQAARRATDPAPAALPSRYIDLGSL